jgi:uncharacterized protein (TIGR00730 family)
MIMPNARPKPPKAYKNLDFLNSPDARIVRMMAEFLEPQRRLRHAKVADTIVVFGSARIRPQAETARDLARTRAKYARTRRATRRMLHEIRSAELAHEMSRYYSDAVELTRLLTRWSKGLTPENRFVVCSGGGPGIMEAANRGASLAGGKSIGLNISLPFEQYPNQYVSPGLDFEFHYFFMRKFWFVYPAKALIVFPGGFGTMDELMEVLTLLQTDKIKKKMAVIVYGTEYWSKILDFRAMAEYGLISPSDLNLFQFADTPEDAFDKLKGFLTKEYPAKGSRKRRR